MLNLPVDLQLSIARRLGVRDRLALGCVCRSASHCVVSTALLEFKVAAKVAVELVRCGSDRDPPAHPAHPADVRPPGTWRYIAGLDRVRCSRTAVCVADPAARKKGHLLPLYEASDPSSSLWQFFGEAHDLDARVHGPTAHGSQGFAPGGGSLVREANLVLPIGLPPAEMSLDLSAATLRVHPSGTLPSSPPRGVALPRAVSLKASLVALDLSRSAHVASVAASGLALLRVVHLPPGVRVANFDSCAQLAELRPTAGGALLSLSLNGCRRLGGACFRIASGAPLLWCLESLAELDLSWCVGIDAETIAAFLLAAPRLRSLGLRGLPLPGVLEALLTAPAPDLTAADLAFSAGLDSGAVVAFAGAHRGLIRCNLRAAASVSTAAYNEVGQLMQARGVAGQADAVENRRRPRHLAPRPAAPFYYLKRTRRAQ